MADKYDFVGQTEMCLDISSGSPFARCVIPAGADHVAIIAGINADIRKAFASRCLHVDFSEDRIGRPFVALQYMSEPEVVKTRAEEAAEWEANREALGRSFRAADEARIAKFATDPDNGKHGYWNVDGVRHSGFVLASSAAEAVNKAIAEGVVGDWESPTASYVGERPEVMG